MLVFARAFTRLYLFYNGLLCSPAERVVLRLVPLFYALPDPTPLKFSSVYAIANKWGWISVEWDQVKHRERETHPTRLKTHWSQLELLLNTLQARSLDKVYIVFLF